MKKTYIFKIYSRNLILDHMLLIVPKIYVQMISKNNDPFLGSSSKNELFLSSNVLSLNRDQGRLYWAIVLKLPFYVPIFLEHPVRLPF